MPDQTDPPAARPIPKLRNVSMREGSPDLLPRRSIKRTPGSWVTPQASLPPERTAEQAPAPAPADHAAISPAARDADRPIFTRQYSQRPAEPMRREGSPILPRTRYRPAATEGAEVDLPPTPALALRLAQRQPTSRSGANGLATPFQLLDQAVRLRLWDPFAFRRHKPPPAG